MDSFVNSLLATLGVWLPRILGVLLILLIGWLVARIFSGLVRKLFGADQARQPSRQVDARLGDQAAQHRGSDRQSGLLQDLFLAVLAALSPLGMTQITALFSGMFNKVFAYCLTLRMPRSWWWWPGWWPPC